MYFIVESEIQLEELRKQVSGSSIYSEIIPGRYTDNPNIGLTAVYIAVLGDSDGYIVPINHNDGLNVDSEDVKGILEKTSQIYCRSKKSFLNYYELGNVVDISMMNTIKYGKDLDYPIEPEVIIWYYRNYKNVDDINTIIPLVKLYEKCNRNYKKFLKVKDDLLEVINYKCWNFYNELYIETLRELDKSKIKIDNNEISKLYPNSNVETKGYINSKYNINNKTSRPTNSIYNINLVAIPKKYEYRSAFKPFNDYFIDMDYDSYHLRIIAGLIGYKFKEESAHKELAHNYYGDNNIGKKEYNEMKRVTFKNIYGGIQKEVKEMEFFKKLSDYIDNLWESFITRGVVHDPISNKPFTSDLDNFDKMNLFNYYIQSIETSINIVVLNNMIEYLKSKKSKIALYVYDSILIDFSLEDGKETLYKIKGIMEDSGFPVKWKYSNSMHFD